ncbi:MAG: alpha/beta hydrolase [Alphaproteobacteria bacterium]|nr:MAG: alpha/beta hydrolase [Alphaproteobacteria bacterium]
MNETHIETSAGKIAIQDTGGTAPALFLIHGNSGSSQIFQKQLNSELADTFRLIAMDLPGHGKSDDARDPENTYHVQGYARIALEVTASLSLENYLVLGWSLGGHAALEMMDMNPAIKGIVITGTPPVGFVGEELVTGFLPSGHMDLTGKADLTEEEIHRYAETTCGVPDTIEPFMIENVRRTDGRARQIMYDSFMAGIGVMERQYVETSKIPLAIINGDPEPFVDNDVLKEINYANLWEGKLHLLPGLGHAPFWLAPDLYNPILQRFARDVLL